MFHTPFRVVSKEAKEQMTTFGVPLFATRPCLVCATQLVELLAVGSVAQSGGARDERQKDDLPGSNPDLSDVTRLI